MLQGVGLVAVLVLSTSGRAQSFNGKWSGVQKTLDNGEQDRALLDLTQSGNTLFGTVQTLGYKSSIKGSTNGAHFKLMAPWDEQRTLATGQLVGKDLHVVWQGHSIVMKPATASDAIPEPAYIAPPPVKDIPYNGLAKTPPMGGTAGTCSRTR